MGRARWKSVTVRLVAASVFLLSGCSAPTGTDLESKPTSAAPSPAPSASALASDGAPDRSNGPTEASPPETPLDDPKSHEPADATSTSDPDTRQSEGASSSPFEAEATVDPTCVVLGDVMRLTVMTEPGVPVIYQAIYEGEEGGGPPPNGSGHGGNDGGYADDDGMYRDEWTVSATAPIGEARVDVIAVRTDGSGSTARVSVPFVVRSRLDGGCP